MQSPRFASSCDAGFTLVEALVSLFVFSIIASGCVAMLMQSVSSQQQVGQTHDGLREIQTARAILSADLLQVAPRQRRSADGAQAPVFLGTGGAGLAFVRAVAEPDATRAVVGRLNAVTYVVEKDRVIRRSSDLLDPMDVETSGDRILLRDAKDARFEFFDGRTWRADWRADVASSPLPRAVALVATVPRYGAVRIQALVEPAS